MLMGTYERAGVPWSPLTHSLGLRPGSAAQRSGAHRAQPGGRLRAFSGAGRRRHQESGERAVHLCARRQSAGGADPRLEELLGRLRRDGRIQPGRRRGPGAVAMDGRRRSGRRHLGHGRGALRRLDHAGLHQRQGAGELFAPFQHPLSERGAAGRAAAAHHADLRKTAGRTRGIRRLLRPGASAVVRADGRGSRGSRQLPPLQRAPARGGGVQGRAELVGSAGDIELRQVRDPRARGARSGCRA